MTENKTHPAIAVGICAVLIVFVLLTCAIIAAPWTLAHTLFAEAILVGLLGWALASLARSSS